MRQPLADRRAGHLQQGAPERDAVPLELRRHGCQTRQSRAPAQRQQQGFDLVVGMLGQQHRPQRQCTGLLRQGGVTGSAGGVFGALPGLVAGVHMADVQGHAQPGAQLRAMGNEGVGRSLQPVVHMQRVDTAGPAGMGGQQQGGGVGTATQGYADATVRIQGGLHCRYESVQRSSAGITCCRPWCR